MQFSSQNVSVPPDSEAELDPCFEQRIHRMHQVTVFGRWAVVWLSWLLFAPVCLWSFREDFALWRQDFTWAAVRFSLAYNPWATFGLALCLGTTLATLIWQSRNILWGLPTRDRKRLELLVCRIQQQGASHPLWKWVCQDTKP